MTRVLQVRRLSCDLFFWAFMAASNASGTLVPFDGDKDSVYVWAKAAREFVSIFAANGYAAVKTWTSQVVFADFLKVHRKKRQALLESLVGEALAGVLAPVGAGGGPSPIVQQSKDLSVLEGNATGNVAFGFDAQYARVHGANIGNAVPLPVFDLMNFVDIVVAQFQVQSLFVMEERMKTIWPSLERSKLYKEARDLVSIHGNDDRRVFDKIACLLPSDRNLALTLPYAPTTTQGLLAELKRMDETEQCQNGVANSHLPLSQPKQAAVVPLVRSTSNSRPPKHQYKRSATLASMKCDFCNNEGHMVRDCRSMFRARAEGMTFEESREIIATGRAARLGGSSSSS